MSEPTWVGPIVAISALIIALTAVVVGIVAVFIGVELKQRAAAMHRVLEWLERDGGPALQQMRVASEGLVDVSKTVRKEIEAVTDLSKDIRRRVVNAADGIEDRLSDMTTLVDMVYEEVQETALDVAAGLRSVRRSRSVWNRVRRALRG